jgi:hypothetical protein
MPDDITEAEAKLRKLGERLRQAWARERPLTQEESETVRQAVRTQWEQGHREKPVPRRIPKAEELQENQPRGQDAEQKRLTRQQNQKRRDQGHGHSH